MTKTDAPGAALQPIADTDTLLDIIAGRIEPPPVDVAALNERITRAMMEAETPAEAAAAGATLSFEDGLLDVPVEVRDIAFRPSSIKGETPVFLIIDGYRLDEGLPCTITCSAAQVMRTLAVWKAKGWLPATFKVSRQEQATAAGFNPYTITPL